MRSSIILLMNFVAFELLLCVNCSFLYIYTSCSGHFSSKPWSDSCSALHLLTPGIINLCTFPGQTNTMHILCDTQSSIPPQFLLVFSSNCLNHHRTLEMICTIHTFWMSIPPQSSSSLSSDVSITTVLCALSISVPEYRSRPVLDIYRDG